MPPDVAEPTSGSVKPKEPIFSQRIIGGSQRCFCVLIATEIDRARREASVNAPEGRDRRVNARQLHGDQTAQQPASAGGPVTLVSDPGDIDVERRELRDDFVRELVPCPIIFNNGLDLCLHEVAHALDDRPLFGIQQVGDFVEVAIHRGRDVRSCFCGSPIGQRVVHHLLLLCRLIFELCFPLACSGD